VIHGTAVVDASARLAPDVRVGPFTVIGPEVEIASGTWIGPHVVINGPTRIGRDNRIFQFASVGEAPQDLKYAGEPTRLEIGDRNTIRECCTIHRGTPGGGGVTRMGDDNLLMAYVHVAHDCQVGNKTIFANNSSLAGHVHVGDQAILGGFTLVHQFCHVGAHCMTGINTVTFKDIPPYLMVGGNTAEPHGLNLRGLKRRGFSEEAIAALKDAYRIVYRDGKTLEQALTALAPLAARVPEVATFADFIRASGRGIIR
jgi:UDP-N-acetylglucosamine acyltransferase